MQPRARARRASTAGGIFAIALWSCTVAASRELSETLGATTAAAAMLLLGGGIGCLLAALGPRGLRSIFRQRRAYLVGCGLLFVCYMVCLYLAIGLASSRQQAIEIGIINYLWPGLTLLLSVPVIGTRVRWTFVPGVVLALLGAVLAPLRSGEYSLAALGQSLLAEPIPYLLALGAALSWASYSVLSRRWGAAEAGAVPVFTLVAGLVLAVVRIGIPERTTWSAWAAALVLFMALCPILVAYSLWDRAMRRGNVTLVAAVSNFAPLLSTVISSLWLRVPLAWTLWLACGLVVAGAALCQRSVVAQDAAGRATAG